ncbi:hypothetical protein FE249_17845 (plasmid) [Acidiphilium multivorum]|uniref:GAD-like domain-containing protein n=1 Tax=Acidiphilium multivorum TaxID=62140 RepID=UPI001F4BE15A|nr:GAD-like domain-containing protein [Acidiphilium multivorum]UNC16119.1 hypothetical protein FE249_17845 [Acidiphilium multivorum]
MNNDARIAKLLSNLKPRLSGFRVTDELREIRVRYGAILPNPMLRFYEEIGVGVHKGGIFQFVNPVTYQPIVDCLFKSCPWLSPSEMAMIGYGPFGNLLIWHRGYGRIMLDTNLCMSILLGVDFRNPAVAPDPNDIFFELHSLISDPEEEFDRTINPGSRSLTRELSKIAGPIGPGDCFDLAELDTGSLGSIGEADYGKIRKTSSREYFLSRIQNRELRLYVRGDEPDDQFAFTYVSNAGDPLAKYELFTARTCDGQSV